MYTTCIMFHSHQSRICVIWHHKSMPWISTSIFIVYLFCNLLYHGAELKLWEAVLGLSHACSVNVYAAFNLINPRSPGGSHVLRGQVSFFFVCSLYLVNEGLLNSQVSLLKNPERKNEIKRTFGPCFIFPVGPWSSTISSISCGGWMGYKWKRGRSEIEKPCLVQTSNVQYTAFFQWHADQVPPLMSQ